MQRFVITVHAGLTNKHLKCRVSKFIKHWLYIYVSGSQRLADSLARAVEPGLGKQAAIEDAHIRNDIVLDCHQQCLNDVTTCVCDAHAHRIECGRRCKRMAVSNT